MPLLGEAAPLRASFNHGSRGIQIVFSKAPDYLRAMIKRLCPCCNKLQPPSHFACASGAMGGSVKSKAKAAASRANGAKRWAKHRAKQAAKSEKGKA